jgi:hypothetical protein
MNASRVGVYEVMYMMEGLGLACSPYSNVWDILFVLVLGRYWTHCVKGERAEHRSRTSPNSRLFWSVQLAEFVHDWSANEFIKLFEHRT